MNFGELRPRSSQERLADEMRVGERAGDGEGRHSSQEPRRSLHEAEHASDDAEGVLDATGNSGLYVVTGTPQGADYALVPITAIGEGSCVGARSRWPWVSVAVTVGHGPHGLLCAAINGTV